MNDPDCFTRSCPMPGATPNGDGTTRFRVWAPRAETVEVVLYRDRESVFPLFAEGGGYWSGDAPAPAGTLYKFRLDGAYTYTDPASRRQPHGVHEASAVVDLRGFEWTDAAWRGIAMRNAVIYEFHVGTFTPEGTLDAAITRLDDLAALGITLVEPLPVCPFPGDRNWGYDGVYPYAVHEAYGGPEALQRFVDACHARGIGVVLDVVYNHLGPEGNYLWAYGPYFTDQYKTPWGSAVNFDGPESDAVREYVIGNVLMWMREYHVDALRLDAIHAIYDSSARPVLDEVAQAVRGLENETGRRHLLIGESDANDPRVISPAEVGGIGFDAQWADDLHHCIHTLLTGERAGYYAGYGTAEMMVRALGCGYSFTGQHDPARGRRHGVYPRGRRGEQFVVCNQNHDQVGNRMKGDRLAAALSFEQLKLAAAATILSPFTPLLFMGEEHAETHPFQFFVSHGDKHLIEAVRKGRREEFSSFGWKEAEVPDPQSIETFERSRLTPPEQWTASQRAMRDYYRALLSLRRTHPLLAPSSMEEVHACELGGASVVMWSRHDARSGGMVAVVMNFSAELQHCALPANLAGASLVFDSNAYEPAASTSAVPATLPPGAALELSAHQCVVLESNAQS